MQQIPHRYDRLADQLEEEFGACPAGRQALLAWLHEQIERARNVPKAPASAVTAMIDSGYVQWCAELLQLDQPVAFGAMPNLDVPDSFDQEDDEIEQLFEGDGDAKGH